MLAQRFTCAGFASALAFVPIPLSGVLGAQTPSTTHGPLRLMMPERADRTLHVRTADLDADGDLDLALVEELAGLRIARWSDEAGFSDVADAVPPYAVASGSHEDLALGDLDGDGAVDAVAVDPSGGASSWSNDGDGTFVPTAWFAGGAGTPRSVALLDVNLDGRLDALAAGGVAVAWIQQPSGSFVAEVLPSATFHTAALVPADLDTDGDPDVVFANPDGKNQLFVNQGGQALVLAPDVLATFESSQCAAVCDLDGDGALDVVFGNAKTIFSTGLDTIHYGNGDGTFQPASVELPQSDSTTSVLVTADFDGDLDLDVFASGNRVLENLGGGAWSDRSAEQLLLPGTLHDAAAGDFDSDGDVDLVKALGEADRLVLNRGDLELHELLAVAPSDATAGALGDLDLDLDLDLLAVGPNGWAVREYRGGGVFTEVEGALPSVPDGVELFDVALADFDADGDLDAFVAGADRPLLLRGAGDGTFTYDAADVPTGPGGRIVAAADIDGDGDLDAVQSGVETVWFRNQGDGVFTLTVPVTPALGLVTTALALGDVNQDGDVDLFRGFAGTYAPRWLGNNGLGGFTSTITMPTAVASAADAAAFDVEQDGDLDTFVAAGDVFDFRSLPGGFFDASGLLPSVGGDVFKIHAGDLDGDGDLDVAGLGDASTFGEPPKVFRNADGLYENATGSVLLWSPQTTFDLLGGDLDLDLDQDLVVLGEDLHVLSNLARHVARRRLPCIGKPFALDVFGRPSAPWVLALSSGTASVPLAPLGTLQLDPAGLVLLGGGALDAEGRGALAGTLPAIPGLAGTMLFVQALVGSPPALTNLEPIELVDL